MGFVQFCLAFATGNSGKNMKKCRGCEHDLENSMKEHVAGSMLSYYQRL